MRSLAGLMFLLAALLSGACGREAPSYEPRYGGQPAGDALHREYIFGIHPLHNPARLFEVYGPIVDRLNREIPDARFVLEASRNYDEFERKLYARHFDLALPNPYETVSALNHGYGVFGKMGDDALFRGIILVRRDSPVRAVADLKGKAVSFPAPTALAATMMPQQYLNDHGLPLSGYESRYVGSQESSIMNAYLGSTAAGATWPPPWLAFKRDHPDHAAQMKILWTTEALVNNGLVARDDFPPELLRKVAAVMFSLQDGAPGREILANLPLSRFEPADAATYRPVGDFVARFARTVRAPDSR